MSSFSVEFDFAPAYELSLSLEAYLRRRNRRTIETGAAWASAVTKGLSDALTRELKGVEPGPLELPPLALVRHCPPPRDALAYVRWLESLSAGDVYQELAPLLPDGMTMPSDLEERRRRWAGLLGRWNEQYFARVGPALTTRLAEALERTQVEVRGLEPEDVVEQCTNGFRVEREGCPDKIVLVPQWHMSPIVRIEPWRPFMILAYAAELPSPAAEPPVGLIRLGRALSDANRLRLLKLLRGGDPLEFTEIVRRSGLGKGTVAHHLAVLRASGLVRAHFWVGGRTAYTFRSSPSASLEGRLDNYLSREP